MRRKDGFMWNAINYSPIPYGGLDKFLGPPLLKWFELNPSMVPPLNFENEH